MSRIVLSFYLVSLAFSVCMPILPLYAIPSLAALGVGCFLHYTEMKSKGFDASVLQRIEHIEKTIAAMAMGGRR